MEQTRVSGGRRREFNGESWGKDVEPCGEAWVEGLTIALMLKSLKDGGQRVDVDDRKMRRTAIQLFQ